MKINKKNAKYYHNLDSIILKNGDIIKITQSAPEGGGVNHDLFINGKKVVSHAHLAEYEKLI